MQPETAGSANHLSSDVTTPQRPKLRHPGISGQQETCTAKLSESPYVHRQQAERSISWPIGTTLYTPF